jgi:hypothetical protein
VEENGWEIILDVEYAWQYLSSNHVLHPVKESFNENPFWPLIERFFDWLERLFGREILPEIFNL